MSACNGRRHAWPRCAVWWREPTRPETAGRWPARPLRGALRSTCPLTKLESVFELFLQLFLYFRFLFFHLAFDKGAEVRFEFELGEWPIHDDRVFSRCDCVVQGFLG